VYDVQIRRTEDPTDAPVWRDLVCGRSWGEVARRAIQKCLEENGDLVAGTNELWLTGIDEDSRKHSTTLRKWSGAWHVMEKELYWEMGADGISHPVMTWDEESP